MSARERYLEVLRRYTAPYQRRPREEGLWAPELEACSRDALRELQLAKLSAAFDYLVECSPYYRDFYRRAGLEQGAIKTFDDIRRIPVTRKTDWIPDIEAHPPWGTFSPLHESGAAHDWMVFSSSGTTRAPRMFRSTQHDRQTWGWLGARALWAYGVRPGTLAANCFFHGPSVAAWGLNEALGLLGCPVLPAGPMPLERKVMFIQNLRPQLLLGTPSTLLTIAERMRELGGHPEALGVKRMVCAGEPGANVPSTRKRLSEAWGGARVYDDFGCTEVAQGPLGYSCEATAAAAGDTIDVHLMEDTLLVEVLDPESLEPVAEGERGTLVVSNLYSEAGPFLRFDMGDWIRVVERSCDCGRTHRFAHGGLLGRNDHCVKIKGLQFFPSTFEDALRSIPGIANEYRIEVRASHRGGQPLGGEPAKDERRWSRDEVKILAETTPAFSLSLKEVAMRLRGILGISVELELLPPKTLPPTDGKGLRFIDRRTEGKA